MSRETAVVREDKETPNDRNDRAIRKGALWYNTHMSETHAPAKGRAVTPLPTVVLLTDDVASRKRSETEGIPSASGESLTRFFVGVLLFVD